MKSLFLLRHAKSSWTDLALDDFDRTLNPRGRRACGLVAAYIASHRIAPELMLCSAAQRVRETVDGLVGAFDAPPEIVFEESLYLAGADRLLARLHAVPDDVGTVMMVGHNPGLEELAGALVGGGDPAVAARMMEKYPTAALAVFTLAADRWRDLDRRGATLDAFVRPRDLTD